MTKKYYWLKLQHDFFSEKRIKKLRKIAGGDTYTIIYLKMQLLSLQNEGKLFFDNVENSFEEEVALQLDEDVEDVKVTIMYLLNCGLLEKIDDEYNLIETQNNIGSETLNAEKMRQLREKRKESVTMLQNVTKCYIEKEKEIDIEKNKEEEKINKKEKLNNLFLNNEFYKNKDVLVNKIKEWLEYKKQRKDKKYTEIGFNKLLKQIENNVNKYGEQQVIDLIDECMSNNYQGIIFDKLKNKKEEVKKYSDEWWDKV